MGLPELSLNKTEKHRYELFEKQFVIEWADVDKMGVLHNGRYARLLEETFTAWLRHREVAVDRLEQLGLCLPVRNRHIRFRRPAFLEQTVTVQMRVQLRSGSPLIRLQYDVWCGDARIAYATVTHVLCKYVKGESAERTTLEKVSIDGILGIKLR